jgi:hypothetical protein
MNRVIVGLMTVLSVFVSSAQAADTQHTLTYADLVKRMTDLERLAVLPAEGETCQQWSSGDRKSRYDAVTNKYVNWDANDDGSGIIRQEGQLEVMAEMKGPGCIYRIWSAQALQGRVKIYLDGRNQPAVDLPFVDYFAGKTAPFDYPQLSYDLAAIGSQGRNLYYPIPYQKSCKIVAEKGWGRYYQFVYTTFPKETKVPTFSKELAAANADALKTVNAFFQHQLGADPAGPRQCQQTTQRTLRVQPGKSGSLEFGGPAAITAIKAKMVFTDREDQMVALRKMAITITFDGEKRADVWCPLGDFFGTAPGVNCYRSLLTGITQDGGYVYWYMPFGKSAKVELVNEDKTARDVGLTIVHAPLSRPFQQFGHFHCKWHRDVHPLPKDRWPDWVMLETVGRGRFCGVMLHVWNPYAGWWGEGDEKFFVDGEKFPSTIGTGSEDYFGYGWCCPTLFQRPFHCQTMTENNEGHQALLRWHVADNVPFQRSFEGCIEKYNRTEERGTQYACTVCWYLAPGGDDRYVPVPAELRDGYYKRPPLIVAGFKVLNVSPGFAIPQEVGDPKTSKWTNGDHLIWGGGGKPGSQLTIAVPVARGGRRDVSVTLTKGGDFSIVQLYLDGTKIGAPIDCYSPQFLLTDPISLGSHELSEGEHKLTVETVGANKNAPQGNTVFAIDQVIISEPR